jgi:hypothetical protein
MKTNKFTSTNAEAGFLIGFVMLSLLAVLLIGCSNDDGPDARDPFIGTYTMVDTNKDGDTDTYNVTLSKASGANIDISNFGDFLNVPLKATVNGSTLTIPLQNFTNPGAAAGLDISGAGTLSGDVITGTYTWILGSYDPVTKDFEATRK